VADCLFCSIVAGELPATVVREDDLTLAFRDLNPQAPTHVLVITKAHHPDVAVVDVQMPPDRTDDMIYAGRLAAEEALEAAPAGLLG